MAPEKTIEVHHEDTDATAMSYTGVLLAILALIIVGIIAYANNWFNFSRPADTSDDTNINLTVPDTDTNDSSSTTLPTGMEATSTME